ncbi:MAG: hypothetical protein M1831_006982 [Alyxoria varia]|nr:MAG: hypothetical protein M1831_006982 [Alyxoria varia]
MPTDQEPQPTSSSTHTPAVATTEGTPTNPNESVAKPAQNTSTSSAHNSNHNTEASKSQTTSQDPFDSTTLPASRTGGTHCTPLDSGYGVLGADDTFGKKYGASWGDRIKGRVSSLTSKGEGEDGKRKGKG